jgi:ABC-type nitrate/sulfonate/bicarbonate transport system substrate-binding protein
MAGYSSRFGWAGWCRGKYPLWHHTCLTYSPVQMNQNRIARRAFIIGTSKAVGALAAGALLSACGGAAATPSPSTSSAPSPSASEAASPAKPEAGSAAKPPLRVAYVVASAAQSPGWMAETTGAFTKRGVDVKLQFVEGSLALKSLVAKELDVVLQSATALINANLNGQADMVYIGSNSNHAQGELLTTPAIKTAADLKGKAVGNDKPGTAIDFYMQLAFKQLGLKLSDAEMRPLGSSEILVQAMRSGQIQATCLTPPQSLTLEANGFNVLLNLYSFPYQGNGPIVLKNRLNELSPALVPFLAGMRDGMVAFNEQPDLAKATIAKYAKIEDPGVLERTYQFHRTSNPFQLDQKPTFEGIQAMLDFLAPSLPAAKTAKPEQFVDLSLLPKLPA